MKKMSTEYNTEKTDFNLNSFNSELKAAQDYINLHPILNLSPGDLKRSGIEIESYLVEYLEAEKRIWLEYYEDEL